MPPEDATSPAPATPVLSLVSMGAALVRGPDGGALTALGAKSLALLFYTAMQPGQAVTRDALVELLWPRGDADQGRASLRQELRRMRKAMGDLFDLAVDAPPGQVALRPGAVRLDAAELERAAQSRDSGGLADTPNHYGGRFLAALAVNEQPFQDWVSIQASHLEETAVEALLRLMLLDEAAGRLDRAAQAARTLLTIDPYQEDVHASLIRIHAAAGRIGAARQQLERCRKLFMEELGEDPGPALAALIPDARAARAASTGAAAPGAAPAPSPLLGGRPVPPARGPRRALAALSLRAAPGAPPQIAALAQQAGAAVVSQLGPCCWLGIGLPDAIAAAGEAGGALFDRATCLADLMLSADSGMLRVDITVSGRPDGAALAGRTLRIPLDGALDPSVALARAAAPALNAAFLAAAEAEAAQEGDCGAADAWAAVMRAHRLLRSGGAAAAEDARDALEAVVKAEPDFVEALCLLSLAHLAELRAGAAPAPREAMFRARELALRALRRRPDSPWAHFALGAATSLDEDPLAAQSRHLHALRLAPGFAPAMAEIARGLALAGDPAEAALWAERAMEAGPQEPCHADALHALALARFGAQDWGAAAGFAAEAATARPDWAAAHLLEAAALRAAGEVAAADRAAARAASRTAQAGGHGASHRGAHPATPEALAAWAPFPDRSLTARIMAEAAHDGAPA